MISTFIRTLERICMLAASACIVFIMLVVSADAIFRYAFHSPLQWAFELISYYVLVAALYFAISPTFQSGDHISIDLFRGVFPAFLRRVLDVIWSLCAAAVFGIIAYSATHEAMTAYRSGEFMIGYLVWPIWVSYFPIALGTSLLVVRLIAHAVQLVINGEDRHVATSGEHVE